VKNVWQMKKLGDLLDVQNGYAFSSKDYSESGHFVMRIGNVQNGHISLADPKFINLPGGGTLQRFVLTEGDILVSLTGNVGRVGVIQKEHLPAALNQRVARITIRKGSLVSREFLLFFLFSDWFREELTGAGHGAAQQNVSTKDIVEISLPVPPPHEQKRIVGILDEAFEGIATARVNAQRNLQNTIDLFDSHLHSLFANGGSRWPRVRLAEVAEYFNGLTYSPKDVSNQGIIVLRSSNIQNDTLDFYDIVRVSCPVKKRLVVREGDILMCSRNGSKKLVGKTAYIGLTFPRFRGQLVKTWCQSLELDRAV
jgi:type I restriction enzyme S subunit